MREAEGLAAAGVRELLVISQDTSAYGVDLKYRQQGLVVINHSSSPFPNLLGSGSRPTCHVLAGFQGRCDWRP